VSVARAPKREAIRKRNLDGSQTERVYDIAPDGTRTLYTQRQIPPRGAHAMTKKEARARAMTAGNPAARPYNETERQARIQRRKARRARNKTSR
jgi:hypothetical protein